MENNEFLWIDIPSNTVADRLRWTSDFLVLASKAISVVACVQGLDYPPDLHRTAQQALWALASYLDDHPSIVADFELAAAVSDTSENDRPSAIAPALTCGRIR